MTKDNKDILRQGGLLERIDNMETLQQNLAKQANSVISKDLQKSSMLVKNWLTEKD